MAWESPTGFVDSGGVWADETLAYDENTGTYAYASALKSAWTEPLELTHDALDCDKVQLWVSILIANINAIEVAVYYGAAYNVIYSGAITAGQFVEYPIGSTQSVTAIRIRFFSTKASTGGCRVHEADFNEVESIVLLPSSIQSLEAFGSPTVNLKIAPSGLITAEAFGLAKLSLYLSPPGISSLEAFGNATVSTGAQFLQPSSIDSLEAFGNPKVNLNIGPGGIASQEACGAPKLNLNLAPQAVSSQEIFGLPELNLVVLPQGIGSLETFGSPKINLTLVPDSIVSGEVFGLPKLIISVEPQAIASSEAFGDATVAIAQVVSPSGITTAEAFGNLKLNLIINASGIPSAEAIGVPNLALIIFAVGLPSAEVFGNAVVVVGGGQVISPVSIETGELVGSPVVSIYVDPEELAKKLAEAKKKMLGNHQPSSKITVMVSGDAGIRFRDSRVKVRR